MRSKAQRYFPLFLLQVTVRGLKPVESVSSVHFKLLETADGFYFLLPIGSFCLFTETSMQVVFIHDFVSILIFNYVLTEFYWGNSFLMSWDYNPSLIWNWVELEKRLRWWRATGWSLWSVIDKMLMSANRIRPWFFLNRASQIQVFIFNWFLLVKHKETQRQSADLQETALKEKIKVIWVSCRRLKVKVKFDGE